MLALNPTNRCVCVCVCVCVFVTVPRDCVCVFFGLSLCCVCGLGFPGTFQEVNDKYFRTLFGFTTCFEVFVFPLLTEIKYCI